MEKTIQIWDVVPGGGRHLIKEEPAAQARVSAAARRMRGPRTPLYGRPINSLRVNAGFTSESRRIWIAIKDDLQESISPEELLTYDLETRKFETIFSTGSEAETPHTRSLGWHDWSQRGSLVAYRAYKQPNMAGDLYIHDRDKNEVLASIADDDLALCYCVISDRGELLATQSQSDVFSRHQGERSGRLELWNPRTGERMRRVKTDGRCLDPAMEFSHGGRDLAVMGGLEHNQIFIVYVNENNIRYTLKAPERPGARAVYFCSLEYTPDDRYLAASRTDGTVLFWDTRDYRQVLWTRLYPATRPGGLLIVLSRDGKRLCAVYGSKDEQNTVKVWDMDQFLALINESKEKE